MYVCMYGHHLRLVILLLHAHTHLSTHIPYNDRFVGNHLEAPLAQLRALPSLIFSHHVTLPPPCCCWNMSSSPRTLHICQYEISSNSSPLTYYLLYALYSEGWNLTNRHWTLCVRGWAVGTILPRVRFNHAQYNRRLTLALGGNIGQ